PDAEGQIVAGYTLGPVIGYGGFSVIRSASSPSGGTVAIKIVKRADLDKRDNPAHARKELDHEAAVWSSLSHEHILPLFSSEHTSYADFFVMLHCPAGSLFDILKRDGRPALPHDDAGTMFRQVVRGVRYLHETAGYVHRDIKLENVLVDEMGVCRIADFGMARPIEGCDNTTESSGLSSSSDDNEGQQGLQRHRSANVQSSRRQTRLGLPVHLSLIRHHGSQQCRQTTIAEGPGAAAAAGYAHKGNKQKKKQKQNYQSGSLPYAAPELLSHQLAQKTRPHPAQDMWALGVLLYALLTGRLPFMDAFEPRLQMKILHGAFEMPQGIGRGAERVIRGCMDPNVRSRWTIAMVDEMAWGVGWG
ncbi:kinase-like protein, partial [Coniophora puteana RWD-64-598 SS2]